MLDLHWRLTVDVPQLDTLLQQIQQLGGQLMAELQGLRDALTALGVNQGNIWDAVAAQLTVIANEIAQLTAESVDQATLDAFTAQIQEAAAAAERQAAEIRLNTTEIAGMVPDEPEPPPA